MKKRNVQQLNKTFYIFLFFLFGGAARLSAQVNLVPNPSFEDTLACPGSNSELYNAYPWAQPTNAGTSDYFNACNNSSVGVPINILGVQNARTGEGYAGFFAYSLYGGYYREYIQVPLNEILIAGHAYCVSFYLSLSDSSEYSISEIGAYFSDTAITYSYHFPNYYPLPYIPQIKSPTGVQISDKKNWVEVSGIYIAEGGEEFITIGNFKDSANTVLQYLGNVGYSAADSQSYYYIDDVSVLACEKPDFFPNVFTPNGDETNDLFTTLHAVFNKYECRIYNRWGNEITTFNEQSQGWTGQTNDGRNCPDGIYYYLVVATDFNEKEYQLKGFVQLLR